MASGCEQENPAAVQAIMRHAKMDKTLYYGHSKKNKRAAVENYAQRIAPESVRAQQSDLLHGQHIVNQQLRIEFCRPHR
jgi:hypothetical protein